MFCVSACTFRQTGEKSPDVRRIVRSIVPDETAHSTKTAFAAPHPVLIPSLPLFHPAFAPPPLTAPPAPTPPDDANCSHLKSASARYWPVTSRLSTALHALIHPLCPSAGGSARRASDGEYPQSTGRRVRCSAIDARGRLPEAACVGEKFRQSKPARANHARRHRAWCRRFCARRGT